MARTFENDSESIGFEAGQAWFRIDRRPVIRDLKRITVFQVDAACAPEMSVGNMKKLRDWIDARLAEAGNDA